MFGSAIQTDIHKSSDVDLLVTFAPDAAISLFDVMDLDGELLFVDSVVVASGHPSGLEANNVTWDITVTELATVVEHRPGIYLLMTYEGEAVGPYWKHRRTTDYFGHNIEKITNAVGYPNEVGKTAAPGPDRKLSGFLRVQIHKMTPGSLQEYRPSRSTEYDGNGYVTSDIANPDLSRIPSLV